MAYWPRLKIRALKIETWIDNIQHSTFNIQPSTFNLQHSTFNIQPWPIGHATRTTYKTPISNRHRSFRSSKNHPTC
ncbi:MULTISPECIES: hypothetical protein [unclassified Moorena]|uniref:hypothetical protein n=1 Tax=unclassified Moorena TaxID=2683338 RepID=UPI0025F8C13D|nr:MULTISPECIES: hypothetical protein [unclassified Moorena]